MLLFLKIDYRLDTTVKCCSDEYDYFSHASTLVFDFDLDYSNQNIRNFRFDQNGKNTPIGFFGTGLLTAPFLLLGSVLSKLIGENINEVILNYQFLFYSISSVVYFFLSYFLIKNTLNILKIHFNKFLLLIIFGGSGITYYAFERFGMTHVYEVFGLSLLINLLCKFYLNLNFKKNIYSIYIPLILTICFLTRMSNYYIFFVPFIVKKLIIDTGFKEVEHLTKSKYFWGSTLISIFFYSQLSYSLYGKFTINPQIVYGSNVTIENIYQSHGSLFELFSSLVKTLYIIVLSNEFGIFWVSPIIFLGFISVLIKNNKFSFTNLLIFLCFAQNFFIIHLWQALGSSYGFRYLYSITPLSILLYYIYLEKFKILRNYLFLFSIFSLLSLLFFETTTLTQLATSDVTNSFGKIIRYSQPQYVRGLFMSFIEMESYLIIFTTSFVGVVFFKILLSLMPISSLNIFLENFNLPVYNADFQDYLIKVNNLMWDKIILIIFIFTYVSYLIVFKWNIKK